MTPEEQTEVINEFRTLLHLVLKLRGKPGHKSANMESFEVYLGQIYLGKGVFLGGETRWVSSVNGENIFFESTFEGPKADDLSFVMPGNLKAIIPQILEATLLDRLADV